MGLKTKILVFNFVIFYEGRMPKNILRTKRKSILPAIIHFFTRAKLKVTLRHRQKLKLKLINVD